MVKRELSMLKNFLFSIILFSLNFFPNTLGLSDNLDGTWNVTYNSQEIIGGFQFNVNDAAILNAYGGDAEQNGFFISTSSTTALGFSLSGGSIPAGDGILIILELDGTPSELNNIVISDPSGSALEFIPASICSLTVVVASGCFFLLLGKKHIGRLREKYGSFSGVICAL